MIPGACQVTFVGMDAVEAAKVEVRAWLPRLGPLTDEMTAAHVVIEALEEHRKERRYRARMELTLRDGVVVVTHDHPSNVPHEDLYVAIRNAFRAARRQLEDHSKARIVSGAIDGRSHTEISDIDMAGLAVAPASGVVPDLTAPGGVPEPGRGMEFEGS